MSAEQAEDNERICGLKAKARRNRDIARNNANNHKPPQIGFADNNNKSRIRTL